MSERTEYAVIGYPNSINLGDEVQSIAAARLLPWVDHYLPRERLDEVTSAQKIKLLCNGFFMYEPAHWPPSEAIDPLFISMHLSSQYHAEPMARKELRDYYAKHLPVGGRDKRTVRIFEENGHAAYFSACVTLTLENPFPPEERSGEILLVDPFYKYQSEDYRNYLENAIIPPQERHRVVHITHSLAPDHGMSEAEKIAKATELLDRYARASLVITSRIHCALPCTGMGTPVLFIANGYDRKHGFERFEGIIDFFNVVDPNHFPLSSRKPFFKLLRMLKLHRLFPVKPLPIDFKSPPANKELHLPYVAAIRKRVAEWLVS